MKSAWSKRPSALTLEVVGLDSTAEMSIFPVVTLRSRVLTAMNLLLSIATSA